MTERAGASGPDDSPGEPWAETAPDDPEAPDPDQALRAAGQALARARKSAREKGLRPGSPARRTRRAADLGTGRAHRDGRDPQTLADQLDRMLVERGWTVDVAAGSVMDRWPQIVGPDVAAHSSPVSFEDGLLVVRADSTAWATQLRLLGSTLLGRIEQSVGADVVRELKITGPAGASWSRGFRRAPGGRGPRDTYG